MVVDTVRKEKGERMPTKSEIKGRLMMKLSDGSCVEIPEEVSLEETETIAEHYEFVRVVRCKDCEYSREEDEFERWCYGFCSPARLVRKDDFCSHGKRR